MAFVTRVVIEGAGESPDAIRAVLDEVQVEVANTLDESFALKTPPRITAEVYDRAKADGHSIDWYKGRRVVWFVEPGGANDPDAGKEK